MVDESPSRIVLASASPRRQALLAGAGIDFSVKTSGVDEEIDDADGPEALVTTLALRKVEAVARSSTTGIVIGADTTVAIDGLILNKPIDEADAARMLRMLRGKTHDVWTGVAVVEVESGRRCVRSVRSQVEMCLYTDAEVSAYVATGEPLDKAGGYAIQGGAGVFVDNISGCYTNVVGLPMCALAELLALVGIESHAIHCRLPDGRPCPNQSRRQRTGNSEQ